MKVSNHQAVVGPLAQGARAATGCASLRRCPEARNVLSAQSMSQGNTISAISDPLSQSVGPSNQKGSPTSCHVGGREAPGQCGGGQAHDSSRLLPEQAPPPPRRTPGAQSSYTVPSPTCLTQHPGDTHPLTRDTTETHVHPARQPLHAIHIHECLCNSLATQIHHT